jgi:ATP-dependent protease ClpP protease subunit
MTKVLVGLIALGIIAISFPIGKKVVDTYRSDGLTREESSNNSKTEVIPESKNLLSSEPLDKTVPPQRVVILEDRNTVVFKGVVTTASVTDAMRKIAKISRNLSKRDPIYLVLDTPGGSVVDGAEFIDFLASIPQTVKTVTLFAASMGFHIVENNTGERLITPNGTLMAHPASLGGLDGQMDGQLESRYNMIKRQVDFLDYTSGKRLGLGLSDYKSLVHNEYWVHGFDATSKKVADAEVLLRCGESLNGVQSIVIPTLFGDVTVDFEKCPIMKQPVAIHMDKIQLQFRNYVYAVIYNLFYAQEQFTRDIIVTNKFNSIFR